LSGARNREPRASECGELTRARHALYALLVCAAGCAHLPGARPSAPELIFIPPFQVRVYPAGAGAPGSRVSLALLLSGDGGWTHSLDSMARALSATGSFVAGIDVRALLETYRHDARGCVSTGSDLAALARFIEQRYQLPRTPPVLIGHSAGATLAYVALAQSPRGTFAGGLTLSFCVDLDLATPLCPALAGLPRSSGVRLLPSNTVSAPWISLHGLDDGVCPASEDRRFVAATPGATFTALPGVSHRYRHPARWWPQFAAAYARLAGSNTAGRTGDRRVTAPRLL
jgi:alpha-beta hydrolase superfamily lysophospholipase